MRAVLFLSKWIVLEPMVMLITMTFSAFITQQHVYRDKIQDLHPNSTDEEITKFTSSFLSKTLMLETALKVLVMLVSGPWSDRHGRKLPLIWCLSFDFLSIACVGLIYQVNTKQDIREAFRIGKR